MEEEKQEIKEEPSKEEKKGESMPAAIWIIIGIPIIIAFVIGLLWFLWPSFMK